MSVGSLRTAAGDGDHGAEAAHELDPGGDRPGPGVPLPQPGGRDHAGDPERGGRTGHQPGERRDAAVQDRDGPDGHDPEQGSEHHGGQAGDGHEDDGGEEGSRTGVHAQTVGGRLRRAHGRPSSTSEVSGLCHDRRVTTQTRPARAAGPAPRRVRMRLDQLLVERGLVETRTRAQALILAGKVRVGEGDGARRDHKPGDQLDGATAAIAIEQPEPYVSRGGHKLAAALDAFGIDPTGRVCLDVGASTGGFTDVLLQRGARAVCMPWTSGAASSPSRCARTHGS